MSKKKWLVAAAAAAVLALLSGGSASAAAPVQVKIYLENNNHNPGSVTADCGETGPLLHTAVFNDAVGADVVETVKIYREDGGPAAAATWPVVWGPADVPIGGHVAVTLPYSAGTSYNAVAIPKGDPWPTTLADLIGRLTAKPPTADNSQLFPSGYPADPECKLPPPPNPCAGTDVPPPVKDLVVVPTPTCPPCPTEPKDTKSVQPVPTCVPPTKPTPTPTATKPTSTPSTTPSTSASTSSVPPTTAPPSTTSSAPLPSATTPAGPTLAHTGSAAAPYAAAGALALVAGTSALVYTRRYRSH